MVVSADYRLKQKAMVHKNGAKVAYTYRVQTVDGKYFVQFMDMRITSPPVILREQYSCTYARSEGVAIVKRIEVARVHTDADTGEEEQAKCLVNLDNMTFRKAVAPPEVKVAAEAPPIGAEADWDDLSRQLIPQLIEKNLDFTTAVRYFRAGSCTIDVGVMMSGMRPSTAKLSYSWEDVGDDGILTPEEIGVKTESALDVIMGQRIEGIRNLLRTFPTGWGLSLYLQCSATTRRSGQGYEMTLRGEEEGQAPLHMTVSKDFRVTKARSRLPDGAPVSTSYGYREAAGKWLLTRFAMSAQTAFPSVDTWTIEYTWRDGVPLLSKARTVTRTTAYTGVFEVYQDYTFSDWKLVKREQPLRLR